MNIKTTFLNSKSPMMGSIKAASFQKINMPKLSMGGSMKLGMNNLGAARSIEAMASHIRPMNLQHIQLGHFTDLHKYEPKFLKAPKLLKKQDGII